MDWKTLLVDLAKYVGALGVIVGSWIAIGGWMPASDRDLTELKTISALKPDVEKSIRQLRQHIAQSDVDQYERAVEGRILRQGAIERDIRERGITETLDAEQRVNAEALTRDKNNLFRAEEERRNGGQ